MAKKIEKERGVINSGGKKSRQLYYLGRKETTDDYYIGRSSIKGEREVSNRAKQKRRVRTIAILGGRKEDPPIIGRTSPPSKGGGRKIPANDRGAEI